MMSCALLVCAGLQSAQASSVRAVGLDELLEAAELVFEGVVVGAQVRQGHHERDIYTEVTFEVLDVIKGAYADRFILLEFSGGTWNGETVAISDLHRPILGDRGIYFVETLGHRQVHPLYGWDQGHLRVDADARSGQEYITTRDRRPVYGVTSIRALGGRSPGLSDGVALGLRLQPRAQDEAPMSCDAFKDTLRQMLKGVGQ
jgi:hypothetical protein